MTILCSRTRRAWLLAGLVIVLAGAAAGVWVATRGASEAPAFTPPVLGAEPPGAVVQAAEDRDLAVALAVKPLGTGLLLVATILRQDGGGARGLGVSFVVHTAAGTAARVRAHAGTAGYYEAVAPSSVRPLRVDVAVSGTGAGPGPVQFRLPGVWPPRPADDLVAAAEGAYRHVRTLVTHERLASDPAHVVVSRYLAVAPNRLAITSDNGTRSVVIGRRRWDRVGNRPWQESAQQAFPVIAPFWTGKVEDATLLGTAVVRGRRASIVSFAAPQMPAFFTAWIDRATGRTLELRMTTAAHFMHHVYGPFDAPLQIRAPA